MVGADVMNSRAGGSGPPDFGKFLQCGASSNATVRSGVLGDVPSDREDPGRVPPQGGPPAGKMQAKRTGRVGASIRR